MRFMETQAAISAARLQRKVGASLDVLVDAVEGDTAIARSTADAPEIDGVVRVTGGGALPVGQFVRVVVTAATDHDLVARVAPSPAANRQR